MYYLKNRNRPIPGGETYRCAATGYKAPAFSSFDAQVQGIVQARLGNPALSRRYRLSTDTKAIATEVDAGLAKIAADNGYTDYYHTGTADRTPGGPPSEPPPRPQKKSSPNLAGLVAGAKTMAEMFGEDGPVQKDLAEKRASVCLPCPMHEKADGDWIAKMFTMPAANAVKAMLGAINGAKLETSIDNQLHICGACSCPLRTKIWAQLPHILKHMPQEAKDALDKGCWIKTLDGLNSPNLE